MKILADKLTVGIDVGYSHVKAVCNGKRVCFPSVVGTPEKSRYGLSDGGAIILTLPEHVQVGSEAVYQATTSKRREDRYWTHAPEWLTLFLAALTELTDDDADLTVVTGLPVSYFEDDRERVKQTIAHQQSNVVQREGRKAQTLAVVSSHVVPQPFGTLASVCLNDAGYIINADLATRPVGVIDIGGHTTNLLSVRGLREIRTESRSVDVGAWNLVRAMRDLLARDLPGLQLRDHQLVEAIVAGHAVYRGLEVSLVEPTAKVARPLAEQILAEATQLWGQGEGFYSILVTGGGGALLAPYITPLFKRLDGTEYAQVVPEPVFANAVGYYRLAKFYETHTYGREIK